MCHRFVQVLVILVGTLSPMLAHSPSWPLQAGFPAQAAQLLRLVRLQPDRLRTVPFLLRDLDQVLQLHWPGSSLTPFGAIVMGLGMWDSDVDCFVMLPNRSRLHEGTILEAQRFLDQHPRLFRRPTAVLAAKVPLVKLIHAPTGHRCDVSFVSLLGVRNTALVTYLMCLDKRALDLTTIVKYWAKMHKPPSAKRIMSNYAMISLVIFYLQQMNVLPRIAYLQENAQTYVADHWETGFNEISYRSSNNDSLLELLGGFFKYYDKFDFKNTIASVFTGTVIKKSVFKYVATVPDTFSLYKQNVGDNGHVPLNIKTPICIQDVFIHNSNLVEKMSPEVFVKFKMDLKFATEVFLETPNDFLELILEENANKQSTNNNKTLVNNCC